MSYTVVGGGISGLAAAHYLRKLPQTKSVTVLESAARLGGWVETSRHGDGAYYEHGPRTLRPSGVAGANTLQLIEELGFQEKIVPVYRDEDAAKNRYIYSGGDITRLPSGLTSRSLWLPVEPFKRPIALAVLQDLFTSADKELPDDEPLHDFVVRRFGEDVANFIIDPMVRGICAGDSREISAAAFILGPLYRMEKEAGGKSVIRHVFKNSMLGRGEKAEFAQSELRHEARRDKWAVYSLQNGLETFVERLRDRLESDDGVEVRTNAKVESVSGANKGSEGKKQPNVTLESGESISCDHVFLTAPSFASARMCRAHCPEISSALSKIPFVSVAVVNVEFQGSDVAPAEAFGFLVPSSSSKSTPLLGAVFDSCAFPPSNGNTIFTVMMGGRWFSSTLGDSPSLGRVQDLAVENLQRIIKHDKAPVRVTTRIQRDCIAQYVVGHLRTVAEARSAAAECGGISLVGSSYDGVGVNDSILSARMAVELIPLLDKNYNLGMSR